MNSTTTTTQKNKLFLKAEGLIPNKLYFKIGDVADILRVKPYVLRYWETEFSILSPQKSGAGQRVYRRPDVENLLMIKHLLYVERYSIEGAKRRIRELRKDGELSRFKKGIVLNPMPMGEPMKTEKTSDAESAAIPDVEIKAASFSSEIIQNLDRELTELLTLSLEPIETLFE